MLICPVEYSLLVSVEVHFGPVFLPRGLHVLFAVATPLKGRQWCIPYYDVVEVVVTGSSG